MEACVQDMIIMCAKNMKYFQYKAGFPIMVSEPKDMNSRKKILESQCRPDFNANSVEQNPGTSIVFFLMKNQAKKP
jgi:hypothetical protein